MTEEVDEKMDYYRARGHYVAYVSKATGEPETIAKATRTELLKGGAYQDELNRLVRKVEIESVLAFRNSDSAIFHSEAPARRARFEEVRRLLLSKSV